MTFPRRVLALAWGGLLCIASLPMVASAHVLGQASGDPLASGFAHPFTGLDHQLAMLAIGVWAALRGDRARPALPVAFVIGAALGLACAGLAPETGAAPVLLSVSVVAVGGCMAFGLRSSSVLAALIALACGVIHGHAHASDLVARSAPETFAVGFLGATALLHGVGFSISACLPPRVRPVLMRATGGAIAAAGTVLVAAAVV